MKRIGRYDLLEELARGGMGQVHKARDPDGRLVAVKVLGVGVFGSETVRKRFRREAEALARVKHPHVVRLHDYEGLSDTHRPYMVLELVEGPTLRERIEQRGPLDVPEAIALTQQLCEAVEACHEAGVLHRDLKPDNVLVADGQLKLTDFGLARDTDPSTSRTQLTTDGQLLGTPHYLSPEQAWGKLDAIGERTDVYGLGATLFALLTGRPPHEGGTVFDILNVIDQPPPAPSTLNPKVPAWLDDVVARALDVKPERRQPSAAQLARELARGLAAGGGASTLKTWGVLLGAGGALALAWLLGWRIVGALEDPAPLGPVATPTMAPTATVATDPQQAVAAGLERTRLALRADDWPAALREANAVLELVPNSPIALCDRGVARSELGLGGVVEDFTRSLLLSPNYARPYLLRGVAFGEAGKLDLALADVETSIRLLPSAPAYFRHGWLRSLRQEWKLAFEDFSRALRLAPNGQYYDARATARANLGDLKGALEDWQRALELEPDAEWAPITRRHMRRAQESLGGR